MHPPLAIASHAPPIPRRAMSVVSNARWIAASQAAKVALQLVSIAVLSRLLTPNDFGLIAMVFVVGNLLGLLRDMGTAAAIVQDPQLTEDTKNAVFWINIGVGTFLCVALLATSGIIAGAFRNDAVMPLLWALAPSFAIVSVGAVPSALLERRSAFALVAKIEIGSALTGFLVTVAAAWLQHGAMSFIYGNLAMAFVSSIAFLAFSNWRPGKIGPTPQLKRLLTFSGQVSAFNFINYFARNTDSFVIGRYLGAASLGIYTNAFKVMLFPIQNMTFVANRALYPVMCRLESTPEQRSLYLKSVGTIALLTAPIMTGVFVLREPFIDVLLGSQWREAADVLQWLAPIGFLQSIVSTTGTVSMVKGRADLLVRVGALVAFLQVTSFVIGVQWGIVGVAVCYLVANACGAIPALRVALRQLDSGFGALLAEIWAPVAAAALMGIVVWEIEQLAGALEGLARLGIGIGIGAIVYAALIFLLAPAKVRLLLTLVPSWRSR